MGEMPAPAAAAVVAAAVLSSLIARLARIGGPSQTGLGLSRRPATSLVPLPEQATSHALGSIVPVVCRGRSPDSPSAPDSRSAAAARLPPSETERPSAVVRKLR